ncbi:MAG TPA: hypothetical protein VH396_09405 [Chitinophagaceae bacterium]
MKTEYKTPGQNRPIKKKEEVQKSNDKHIDQDFEGYPHNPASENIINPKSEEDNVMAGIKDGENLTRDNKKSEKNNVSKESEEINSDGSANAFERAEGVPVTPPHDKPKIDEHSKVY